MVARVGRAFRGENGFPAVVRLSGDRGLGCPGRGQCSRIVVGGSPTPVVCDRLRSCISRVLRAAVWALQCRFEHVDQILLVRAVLAGHRRLVCSMVRALMH